MNQAVSWLMDASESDSEFKRALSQSSNQNEAQTPLLPIYPLLEEISESDREEKQKITNAKFPNMNALFKRSIVRRTRAIPGGSVINENISPQ